MRVTKRYVDSLAAFAETDQDLGRLGNLQSTWRHTRSRKPYWMGRGGGKEIIEIATAS